MSDGWCCSLPGECGLVKYCIIRNSDYHNWFLGEQWFPGWEMFQKRYPRLGQKQTSILTVTRWLHSHENCVGCLRFMSCLYTLQFLLNYISNYINTNLTAILENFLSKFFRFSRRSFVLHWSTLMMRVKRKLLVIFIFTTLIVEYFNNFQKKEKLVWIHPLIKQLFIQLIRKVIICCILRGRVQFVFLIESITKIITVRLKL